MDRIDFRSDTVTWPTELMREAMATARVGDDVYGEDPTVNALQEQAAGMLGMEAALFVASGTMGNLSAILAHAGRGDEAIAAQGSHTVSAEAGGMAALGGIMPRVLPVDEFGRLSIDELESAINDDDPHYARTRLVLLENTVGGRNGYPLPPSYFADVASMARSQGLRIHVDGARFFNATVALGVAPAAITQHVDSVTFCLSKGLCAPVGSVLCGSRAFIDRARRARKILGGGMRQAGIMAAAGTVALDTMVERLRDDHANARRMADGLQQIPGITVERPEVRTNIVFFRLNEHAAVGKGEVVDYLRELGNIWIEAHGAGEFRAVTHYWIGRREVDLFLELLREILTEGVALRRASL